MEVVILCGGKGTRMGETSEKLPKPLLNIGGKPVLEHIMEIYSSQGYKNFILCAGYGAKKINNFANEVGPKNKWEIKVRDTGLETLKSERVKLVEDLIEGDTFFLSYGDDLANISLNTLLDFHKNHGKIATITGVKMQSPYGIIKSDKNGKINNFEEKPLLDIWINGGYMVLNKEIFKSLHKGELEEKVLPFLASKGEVYMHKHLGKWKSMNTQKDNFELNQLWDKNQAFWRAE